MKLNGDRRLDRVVGGQEPARGRDERDADAEGEAVHGADVDPLVARGLRVIRRRAQRLAEIGPREEHVDDAGEHERQQEGVGPRLVQ